MKTHLACLCSLAFAATFPLGAGTLLRTGFETSDWTGKSASASIPSVTASAAYGDHGTIDVQTDVVANGTDQNSKGILLTVNSSAAAGPWKAGVNSGVLSLTTANTTITDPGLITLSFSLRASRANPVVVRLESYDAAGTIRTGGLSKLIYPASADYYQRFALDLSTMKPDGTGTFVPTATKIAVTFELDSTAGGDGWPNAANHTLRIDNLHYATPKYYVAATGGADNTSGGRGTTAALPFATPAYAVSQSSPGDIIVVRGGTYNGAVNFRKFVGSAFVCIAGEPDAWITLKNYPGEKPIIRHTQWGVITIGLGSTATPYTGPPAAYLEVRGLTVRGFSTVDANGDRNLDPSVANPTLLSKLGPSFGETNCNGIYVEGRRMTQLLHDFRFADNIVENNSGGGISTHRADRILIENNISRNNAWWCSYGPSGISTLVPADFENNGDYRAVIQGNQTSGNETMFPWIADSKFSDGNGIIIDVNRNVEVTTSTTDPAYRARTLVQNNLTFNNGGSGIHAFNSQNVDIIHNTAWSNSASPRLQYSQLYAGYSKNVRMSGNIIVAPNNITGDASRNESFTSNSNNVAGTVFFQNNLLFGLGNNVAVPNVATFTPNVTANPQFFAPAREERYANFQLRSASAGRNAAPAISYRSALDVTSRPRPLSLVSPDQGAYQTQSANAFAPVLSPVPGNYSGNQLVALTGDTPGSIFIYTTNGSTPTVDASGNPVNGTLYTAPVSVSSATTLRAIAWKSGLGASDVSGGDYTFTDLSTVPVPDLIFYPEGGTYAGTQLLAIVCRTPGALVRYTTDGSPPSSTNGILVGQPMISISNATTIKAVAYLPGRANSAVKSASYTITGTFGNVSEGTQLETIGANKIRYSRFLATSGNLLKNVYARISGAGNYRVALYDDSAGVPTTRLSTSGVVTNPAAGWNTFTFGTAYAIKAGTYYWLAIWSDNANAAVYTDTTGGTVREATSNLGGNGTWPNPAGTTTVSANPGYEFSLYATPQNIAPSVTITQADAFVTLPAGATLTGEATDDGIPQIPGTTSVLWSKTSGPGTVTFGSPASLTTTANFSSAGTYVLRLTANDGSAGNFDEVTVDVSNNIGNQPQVIYRETFGNAIGAASPAVRFNAATIGWQHYTAPNDVTNITDASGTNGGSDYRAGRPADLPNVNAGVSDSQEFGYANSLNASRALAFTTEFPVDRSLFIPTTISWYSHISATNSGSNNQSPAVRVGGQWYVITLSTAPAGNLTTVGGGGNFNTSATVLALDFATATATSSTGVTTSGWRQLAASPGTPFSISPNVVPLPSGNIEAFGVFFTTAGASTARFDSFQIEAIPNPALPTITVLASDSNPADSGATVNLTASVTSGAGIPTGSVNFFDGATLLGSSPLVSGIASLPVSTLPAGVRSISANYVPVGDFAASVSSPLAQTIRATTTTALASNVNPSDPGQPVTFTAAVTSALGTPAGNVSFYDDVTLLGTSPLVSGTATLSVSGLTSVTHVITATYETSTSHSESTSPILSQIVRLPTSTTVVSSVNPSNPGQPVTLTATVTSGGGTPDGTVTFFDGGNEIGTGTLDGGGSASLTTSILPSGARSITASYAASTNFAASTSAAISQNVRYATTTTLASSANPANFGSPVTFTANVSSTSGTPTGTVTFFDGATNLGSAALNGSGTAVLTTAATASGSRSITAGYGGDPTRAPGTSAVLAQTINPGPPTWTGEGTDGLYGNPANWAGGTVPASTDTAVFPNNVNTSVTLAANHIFQSLQFGAGAGSFTFNPSSPGFKFIGNASGSTLSVLNTISGNPVITINSDLVLSQNRTNNATFTLSNNSPAASLVVNGNISGAVSTPTLTSQLNLRGTGAAYETGTLQLNGVISDGTLGGNVSINKTGGANQSATAALNGANTYSGGTDFSSASGTLALGHPAALGTGEVRIATGSPGVTFRADANLSGPNAVSNPIRYFGSTGTAVSPAPTATSTTVGGDTFTVSSSTGLAVGQVVSGTGLPLNSRITAIDGLVVTISKPIPLTATNFTLTAAAYTGGGGGLTVFSGANPIEFSGPVWLTTANSNLTGGTQNFRVTNSGGVTISGILQQESVAGLTKTGGQSLTLTAANTYTGATTIHHGTLLINGLQTAATGATTVNSNAASSSTFTSTTGSNSINGGSTTGLVPGQTVTGPGVPPGSFITAITNSTTFTLQTSAMAGAGTGQFTFGATTGTLGGHGTIGGTVTIGSGGYLSPGPAAGTTGVLKLKSTLLLNPGSNTILEINGISRGVNHDAVDVTGAVTYGGNLLLDVTSPLPTGSDLSLFSAAGSSGGFATVAITGSGHGAGSLTQQGPGLWTGTVGGVMFTFDQADGSLTVSSGWSLIESWRDLNFDSPDNSGDGADNADPDFDGLVNLLEYATGTHPKNFNQSPASDITPNGILDLTFQRIADPSLLYEVQASPDMNVWTLVGSSTGAQNVEGPVTFPDLPPPGATARFLRLKVSKP